MSTNIEPEAVGIELSNDICRECGHALVEDTYGVYDMCSNPACDHRQVAH